MRTNILGGGPAGLYLSILLKKRSPADEVVVYERNTPEDTFGWGVVFSDETLGNLTAKELRKKVLRMKSKSRRAKATQSSETPSD